METNRQNTDLKSKFFLPFAFFLSEELQQLKLQQTLIVWIIKFIGKKLTTHLLITGFDATSSSVIAPSTYEQSKLVVKLYSASVSVVDSTLNRQNFL